MADLEHEHVLEAVQRRLDNNPQAMNGTHRELALLLAERQRFRRTFSQN
jgi:hypothetical protein